MVCVVDSNRDDSLRIDVHERDWETLMLFVIHFLFFDSKMRLRTCVKISKPDEQGIWFFMKRLDRFLFDLVVNVEDRVANFLSASSHVCIRKHNFLGRVDCIFEFLLLPTVLVVLIVKSWTFHTFSSCSLQQCITVWVCVSVCVWERESDANVCTRIGSLELVLKRVCLVGDTFTHEHDVVRNRAHFKGMPLEWFSSPSKEQMLPLVLTVLMLRCM